jgi:subtilase family serine protease
MYKKMLAAAAGLAAACLGVTAPALPAFGAGGAASHSSAPATHHVCAAPTKPKQSSCFAIAQTNPVQPTRTPGGMQPFTTPNGYGPADLQSAYGFPAGDPDPGRPVAIVDAYGAPNLDADVATYRAQYGLPACTTSNGCLNIVNQSGQTSPLPPGDSDWSLETTLDVDMVSATCPKCRILVVQANSAYDSDLFAAISTAINLNAKFVSLSWGHSEDSSETSLDSYLNHTDVAITAASGDFGYGVDYPAASPYAVAVGGTSLSRASNARGWTESAWSGAGSGCSAYEAKPAFQLDSGCPRRTVVDVSAVADPDTGVAVYDSYNQSGWEVIGGTSVSTPIIASVYALSGLPIGNAHANSYPYSNWRLERLVRHLPLQWRDRLRRSDRPGYAARQQLILGARLGRRQDRLYGLRR